MVVSILESFDCMIEQGQKLVSTWDADLHLRLKQLDSELDLAKHGNVEGLLDIKHDQENHDNKAKTGSSGTDELNSRPILAVGNSTIKHEHTNSAFYPSAELEGGIRNISHFL